MKTKTWLTVAAVALTAYGAYRVVRPSHEAEAAADPKLFFDRAWLEKAPESATQRVHALFALSRHANGGFFQGSSWAGRFERFTFEANKGELRLNFPQQSKKATITYKVTACNEQGFDLCLDLSENPWGGPKRYYGTTEESSLPPAAREIAAELPH